MCTRKRVNQIQTSKIIIILLILGGSAGTILAVANGHTASIRDLADEITMAANDLREASQSTSFDADKADEIITELKELIKEYEEAMIFAESPYPGEILLGTTPGGDSTWLECLCDSRYDGLFKEIRIRRTGYRADYLRINDIEISYMAPGGIVKEIFNESGRVKLNHGDVFKLALPRPMRIRRIRININHESTGLEVTGIPFSSSDREPPRPVVTHVEVQAFLMGKTQAGQNTWLETTCGNPTNRAVKEILLRRANAKARFVLIKDIEVTYRVGSWSRKEVFNKDGKFRLRPYGTYRLKLPQPMHVTNIRILIENESSGLEVYGVY
jgi:hypothetical protein